MQNVQNRLENLQHPDFRVIAVHYSNNPVVDIELVPRNPEGVTVLANVAATLVKNTPDDGILGVFEKWFRDGNTPLTQTDKFRHQYFGTKPLKTEPITPVDRGESVVVPLNPCVTIQTPEGECLNYELLPSERHIQARVDGGIRTFDDDMNPVRELSPESAWKDHDGDVNKMVADQNALAAKSEI